MGTFSLLHSRLIVGTDRISPSTSMLELVRALGVAWGGSAGKARSPQSASQRSGTAAAHDLTVLRQRLAALLASTDPDDEQAAAGIRRPLLQEIVLWEFGSDFRRDPEFAPMLDGIEQAFVADPRSAERLSRLIRHLGK